MTGEHKRQLWRRKAGLWIGLLGPPVAWLLNLQTTYSLVPWTCQHGKFFIVYISIIFFIACAAVSGVIGVVSWQAAERAPEPPGGEGLHEVAQFMGRTGLALCCFFAVVILAQSIPTFVLSPCAE